MRFLAVFGLGLGVSGEGPRVRIIGGATSSLEQVPFLVSITSCIADECQLVCSGSLIAPRVVLTAAHCVRAPLSRPGDTTLDPPMESLYVISGTSNIGSDTLGATAVVSKVRSVAVGGYGTNYLFPMDGDIALLELSDCVKGPLLTATVSVATTDPGVCADVTVAGFGQMSNAPAPLSDYNGIARMFTDKLHSAAVCKDAYVSLVQDKDLPDYSSATFGTKHQLVGDSFMCLGGDSWQSACFGDSGGPVAFQRPTGEWEIVGVVSFGFGGDMCTLGPDFVTKVSFYADWISAEMQKMNSCPTWSVGYSFAQWPLPAAATKSSEYTATRCASSLWQCVSSECISRSKVCDGHADCKDGSDENFKIDGIGICEASPAARSAPRARKRPVFKTSLFSKAIIVSKSATVKAATLTCSQAVVAVQQRIQSLESLDLSGDMWDSQLIVADCDVLATSCTAESGSLVTGHATVRDSCAMLSDYVSFNKAAAAYAETFDGRFGASCAATSIAPTSTASKTTTVAPTTRSTYSESSSAGTDDATTYSPTSDSVGTDTTTSDSTMMSSTRRVPTTTGTTTIGYEDPEWLWTFSLPPGQTTESSALNFPLELVITFLVLCM